MPPNPILIRAARDPLDPVGVVEVPLHGPTQPRLEGLGGTPAELRPNLRHVDRVAAVMAGPVPDVGDELAAAGDAAPRRERPDLVENVTYRADDLDIRPLGQSADVVDLARAAPLEHRADGRAMVAHVEPVAHLQPVSVDRQRLQREGVADHERDQLLGELPRAIIIGAVGREDRQAVCVVVGPHQVVGGGLAGAVGAVGLVAVGLGEGRRARLERPVDLVGRDVEEAEVAPPRLGQITPVGTHRLEEALRAQYVGLHEGLGSLDGAVDVALGRKIEDGAGPVARKQLRHEPRVRYVAARERVARVPLYSGQAVEVAGIGQRVEAHYSLPAPAEPLEHEIGADEARRASYEDRHELSPSNMFRKLHTLQTTSS